MFNYYQPEFYHFSSDSVQLAKWGVAQLRAKQKLVGLDICSGCGVIGLEVLLQSNIFSSMDFCEKQSEFKSSFIQNVQQLDASCRDQASFYLESFEEFKKNDKNIYDVIFCNPPYFIEEYGRLGKNNKRNTCRLISKDKLDHLLKVIHRLLKKNGILLMSFRGYLPIDELFKVNKKSICDGAELFLMSSLNKDGN